MGLPASLACVRCGAPVALPADLTALDAPCGFCGTRTSLPAELARLRLEQQQQLVEQQQRLVEQQQQILAQAQQGESVRRTMSWVMWIVILSVAVPLVITVVVLVFAFSMASQAGPAVHHR